MTEAGMSVSLMLVCQEVAINPPAVCSADSKSENACPSSCALLCISSVTAPGVSMTKL